MASLSDLKLSDFQWWHLAAIGAGLFLTYSLFPRKRQNYKGKSIIITGASSGIGEELAVQYAKLGARLVLAARRIDRLNDLVNKCKSLGAADAIAVQVDVTKESDCKNLIDKTIQAYAAIDLLLLNAGQSCLIKVSELTDLYPYRQTMEINYWGYVYPTIYALPFLRTSHGTITVISSLSAIFPTPRRAAYSASKLAVHGFFNCLRTEEPNIQVTIVAPGFVMSEIHDKAFSVSKLEREKKKFMSTPECASIIIDAAATGKREEIMTTSAKFANIARVFFPTLIEKMVLKRSEDSVKHRPKE
eukprot:TRINITY_DN2451_c0_g1_i3.p1 TRINITY_DN2451_c0_g1~~TRINITY_DN2451_c0_g1_i3.p1  ORF type:complete len:302 (-),score=86.92 TRINITY_DN2451_c0_g1_i3:17-922(-)